ncbi:MAG: Hsp20/alpha crystallin family protein [Lachnospiraceae bacterium]|nr:Hsp20/alpha crystallin family protein [Lachnospiraceae bacterium]
MMMPSIFGESLLDDFFGFRDPFREYPVVDKNSLMKTDVKESETGYQLEISLPGYQKENIHAELENGYLTVHAATSQQKDEKDETTGKYIRRERFSGSCSRSFYVGEDITEEDIKAKYENGVLTLAIPKKEVKKIEESKKMIAIEG